MTKKKLKQHGHFLAWGIFLGTACGGLLGFIMVNVLNQPGMLSVGFASGVATGTAVGFGLEAKYNIKAKPLINKTQRLLLTIVLFGSILIFACLLALFIIANN